MGRRKRDDFDFFEMITKAALALLILAAFSIGGVKGFAHTLNSLLALILVLVFGGGAVLLAVIVGIKFYRRRNTIAPPPPASAQFSPEPTWNAARVRAALNDIDWYQFEKFCAALLRAEGFSVERKGGATPDGGVDLLVEKSGARALIQCKHWRTWVVQEKVVREMLGSMTHFNVS